MQWNANQGTCSQIFAAAPTPSKREAEHFRVNADAAQDGFLILRLRRYPAWEVRVNGTLPHNLPERSDGLIAVPVAQGLNRVSVDWTTTSDAWIGRWAAVLALLLLIALTAFEKRQARPRLS